ncbi:hypothetical protein NL676_025656 [Syzygium grande]|nr:hypothetical protein NL676_025656 [Syzygium grande]
MWLFFGSSTIYACRIITIWVDVGRFPYVSYKFVAWYEKQGKVLIGPLDFGSDGDSGGIGSDGFSGANGVCGGEGGVVDISSEESDLEEIRNLMED